MLASILSPVSITKSRLIWWGITMSAPVFCSDIVLHASVISFTAPLSSGLASFPRNLFRKFLAPAPNLELLPNFIRKCRISGWNMMITASTPTSMNVPSNALTSFIFNASAITLKT